MGAGTGTLQPRLPWKGEINIFRASLCGFGALQPKHKEYIPKLKPQNFYLFIHLHVCICVYTVHILMQIYVYTHIYKNLFNERGDFFIFFYLSGNTDCALELFLK